MTITKIVDLPRKLWSKHSNTLYSERSSCRLTILMISRTHIEKLNKICSTACFNTLINFIISLLLVIFEDIFVLSSFLHQRAFKFFPISSMIVNERGESYWCSYANIGGKWITKNYRWNTYNWNYRYSNRY